MQIAKEIQRFEPYPLWNWPVHPFQGQYFYCLITFSAVCYHHLLMETASFVVPAKEAVVVAGSELEADEMAAKTA